MVGHTQNTRVEKLLDIRIYYRIVKSHVSHSHKQNSKIWIGHKVILLFTNISNWVIECTICSGGHTVHITHVMHTILYYNHGYL